MANRSLKKKKKLNTTLGKAPTDKENAKDGDISNLWKPIETSIYGLRHALSLFENATDEVRRLLMYECDLIYECRICRNLYRSLANFILHKRSYCNDRYKNNPQKDFFNEKTDYIISYDDEMAGKTEDGEEACVTEKRKIDTVLERLDKKREAARLVENLVNTEEKDYEGDEDEEVKSNNDEEDDEKNIRLEKIQNSKAVFQTFTRNLRSMTKESGMKSEVMEIHTILDKNEVILDKDGKAINFPSSRENNLTCTICSHKFSTKKTLSSHIKIKHTTSKLVFPCPACKDVFASSWSVFRHLFKVHRKTAAQVRRLRNQIQAKAYHKDQQSQQNKKKFISTPEDEQNEWMENLEGDNDLQMCGGCGKRFERKAALHSHSALCSKRIALCNTLIVNKLKRNTPTDESAAQEKAQLCKENDISPGAMEENPRRGAARRKPNILLRRVPPKNSETDVEKDEKSESEIEKESRDEKNVSPSLTEENQARIFDSEYEQQEECSKDDDTQTQTEDVPETIAESPKKKSEKISESLGDADAKDEEPQEKERTGLEQGELYKIIGISVSAEADDSAHHSDDSQVIYINDSTDEDVVECEIEETVEEEEEEEEDEEELQALFEDDADKTEVQPHVSDILDAIDTNLAGEENGLQESAKEVPVEDVIFVNEEVVLCDEDSGNSSRKRKLSDSECFSSCDDLKRRSVDRANAPTEDKRCSFENLDAKMHLHVNMDSFTCSRCELTFVDLEQLRGHMSLHFNWYRYQCDLCSFRCYQKVQTFAHVIKKHNVQDREQIEEAIFDIPEWKSAKYCSQTFLDIVSQPAVPPENAFGDSGNEEEESSADKDCFLVQQRAAYAKNVSESDSSDNNCLEMFPMKPVTAENDSDENVENHVIDLSEIEDVEGEPTSEKISSGSEKLTEKCEDNGNAEELATEKKDPEVIKMVMEVIFGSGTQNNPTANVTATLKESSSPEMVNSSLESSASPANANADSVLASDENRSGAVSEIAVSSKESSASPVDPDPLPVTSRPIRQRTPFVHKDFLYDMSTLLKGKVSKDANNENKSNRLARKGVAKFCAKINRDLDNNVQFPAVPKIRLRKCEDLYVRCDENAET